MKGMVFIMRRIWMTFSMIMLLLLSGCSKDKQGNEDAATISPTTLPEVTIPAGEVPEDITEEEISEENYTLSDYYPMLADTVYVYEGKGNEFAFYNRVTDFLDVANNRIQTRVNNGGTETVRVIERKDGKLSVIRMVNECYYRENILADAVADEGAEVLLMEPLVKGTEWLLPDGRKRFISATQVTVDTPIGSLQAIEVTTNSDDSSTQDYYAPKFGLIKSVFRSGDMEVSSTLSEIKEDTPYTQILTVYYPDVDEKIYVEHLSLVFGTGDDTKKIIQEAISKEAAKDSYLPLASINTKINDLYLGENNIVHVDFSAELVTDMNAGAGYEALILQSITNTLGNYYGVQEVLITVEGKPYESGHILMNEGETFQVNYDNVVE